MVTASRLRKKIPGKRSPYYSNLVGDASFTVGGAATDASRTVAIQLKDQNGQDLTVKGAVKAFIAGDANGNSVIGTAPNGGVAAGTDGVLLPDPPSLADALLVKGTLAIDAVAEKFKTTTKAAYTLNGLSYTKAAATAIVFSAAHVVTASKFGVILIQVNAAGTVSTKVPGSPQAYNSAPLALAALPSPDAGNVALGYIAIANNAGDWTANTDDLTDGSDLTTAGFNDSAEVTLNAVPKKFTLISEDDGDIDVTLTESGVATFRLAVILPDGSVVVSSAISFT